MRSLAALGVLGLVAGCVTPVKDAALPPSSASGLKGREITLTVHDKPDFFAGQSSVMGFTGGGLIAAGIMISNGNKLVADNRIEDPAIVIGRALSANLGEAYETRLAATTVPAKTDDPAELARQNPRADLLLDVATSGWSLNYFPTAWTRYRVTYGARMRLIDVKRGEVIAQGACRRLPEETPDAPTYDDLVADGAARLKQELGIAAEQCIRSWSKTALLLQDPKAWLALVTPQGAQRTVVAPAVAAAAIAPVAALASTLPGFGTPLPQNVKVQPPAGDVPAELAAFSGAWAGKWGTNGRTHTLVVERVEGRNARIVYSWGAGRPGFENPEPGFRRVSGEFSADGSLQVTMPNGASVTYSLASDRRTLNGEWRRNVQRFDGVFERRELPAD